MPHQWKSTAIWQQRVSRCKQGRLRKEPATWLNSEDATKIICWEIPKRRPMRYLNSPRLLLVELHVLENDTKINLRCHGVEYHFLFAVYKQGLMFLGTRLSSLGFVRREWIRRGGGWTLSHQTGHANIIYLRVLSGGREFIYRSLSCRPVYILYRLACRRDSLHGLHFTSTVCPSMGLDLKGGSTGWEIRQLSRDSTC